jgi:uncharacterized protein
MTDKQVQDGFANIVSKLGTDRDKASHGAYFFSQLSDQDLITVYKSSGLARRLIDLFAEEPCREWRSWQADKDQISAIEKEERRLGLKPKLVYAQKMANLFGLSAILIGDGAADITKPIDPSKIRKEGLKYLSVLSKNQFTAGQIDWRIGSEYFGKPEKWTLNLHGDSGKDIHPSRLVLLYGHEPMGDLDVNLTMGAGDSILQAGYPSIKRVDEIAANIASLTYEAKVDVVSIPEFTRKLAEGGAEYEALFMQRAALAGRAKGINGTLYLDAEETYQSKSASFGGLPELFDRFTQMVSAEYGVPMAFLGRSAGGLNSTGESDTRAFYDRIATRQAHMGLAMGVLDECLIYSALGQRPESVFYEWNPLWQPTAKERAETGNIIMEALTKLDNLQGYPAGTIGKAATNALIESGAFSGLEAAIDEAGDDADIEPQEGGDTDI